MENLYEDLNVMEKEVFKKVINQLLGRTFIVNHIYDENKKTAIMNPDYRFVERNIELFRKYLDLGGWKLERNDNYEVIYITSNYGYNKMRLDKFTTVILYILRLMYDQKRENINLTEQIIVSVGEIINTLNEIGAYDKKKPSNAEIKGALRTIAGFNIIQKIDGPFENPETKIIILPSILFAVTAESITKINESVKNGETDDSETDDTVIEDIKKDDIENDIIMGEDVEWKF